MKTLVLGLGNPLVSNDSVGLRVVTELRPRLAGRGDVEVDVDYWGGLWLMERMIGYDRVIVIDAVRTGADPGTVHQLTPNAMPIPQSVSAHDVNLAAALNFGRQAGMHLPRDENILVVGIEAKELLTFSENCTPADKAAIPRAVQDVIRALDQPSHHLEHAER